MDEISRDENGKMKIQFDRKRHGSLFDRGSADSFYGRPTDPHWYPDGSYNGVVVTALTPEEALSGAPAQEENRFRVPQILGEE